MENKFSNRSPLASLKTLSSKVALIISMLLIASCGGGSGSSGDDSPDMSGSNSDGASDFTVDMGPDLDIDEGETVQIIPDYRGAQGDIVGHEFSAVGETSVSLSVVDFAAMHYEFTGPTTGREETVGYSLRFTLEDEGGNKASDTLYITVHRVNDPPEIDEVQTVSVKGDSDVTLTSNAEDPDGDIISYQWVQTSGESVELNGAESEALAFFAPSTDEDLELVFRLTVTDNDGASAEGSFVVTVTPENAPDLTLHFPPQSTLYTDTSIPVSGVVSALAGADIESVVVITDVGEYQASLLDGDYWRLDEAVLPSGLESTKLQVVATDSAGRSSTVSASLMMEGGQKIGSGQSLEDPISMCIDDDESLIWVLTDGSSISRTGIIPVELKTGNRGDSVSDFSDESSGVRQMALTAMVCDFDAGYFYLASSPADDTLEPLLYRVSMATGARELLSGNGRGDGPVLAHPASMVLGPNGDLLVSNNHARTILSIDVGTGNRTELTNQETGGGAVDYPSVLAWDSAKEHLLVVSNGSPDSSVSQADLSSDVVTASIFSPATSTISGVRSIGSAPASMSIDAMGGLAYVLPSRAFSERFVVIDLESGNREGRPVQPGFDDAMDVTPDYFVYHSDQRLIYFGLAGYSNAIYAMDPETGVAAPVSYVSWRN